MSSPTPVVTPERLELPTGRVAQRVPMTSAVKVGGERLYKRAHRGEEIETPVREIEVRRAELLDSNAERASSRSSAPREPTCGP